MGFLSGIGKWFVGIFLDKLINFILKLIGKQTKRRKIKQEVDQEVEAVESAVKDIEETIAAGGTPSAAQEKRLRDAARRLNSDYL